MSTRRDFIKIAATGLGGLALGAGSVAWFRGTSRWAETAAKAAAGFQGRFPTYCEICFWSCAGWTYTDEEGRITRITGNAGDPHCNGRLCPRGTGGVGAYYDEDRLRTPLIRKEINGKQEFVPAGWDEALDLVAERLKEISRKHGPESIALFNHGSPGDHFGHLLKAMGSNNIAAPSFAQCRGPRDTGWYVTFGTGVGSPEPTDIRDTRCLVLIGSHIGENMHNGQVQEMADAIDRGATLITVDPRFSTAASKSRFWLPIKPSTDLALLMAWIHVLIYEELYNRDYVERYTYGFDLLKEHVRNMTPEWAYGITTLQPALIRETARQMADAAPSVIVHPGRHVTWYGDDTQRTRAIAILNALLGSWGSRGGFYFAESVQVPDYPHPEYPTPAWSWQDLQREKYPLAGLAVSNVLVEASLKETEESRRIRAWIVAGTNLPLTIPLKKTLQQAMQDVEFMVVVDTMPMEITGYADVVLPECTYLERYDTLRSLAHREPNIALRMPAAEPMYDSKPSWWMAKQLGERLGLGSYFNYKDYTDVLEWQLQQLGTSLEEMKKTGVKKFPRTSGPLYFQKGENYTFNTNTGKIELYATELAATGYDPMPVYTPHEEPPPGYYRLIYGRAPMHTFSRTANNPNLTDLMDQNDVWVNPRVARLWGLENGQYVHLKNPEGIVSSFPIRVRITERIRWDSVYMVHGFGHSWKKLSRAYGKGANDTELMSKVTIDPVMGGTGMRGNFVTFVTEEPVAKEVES
ncbi:MAG TPA: nitrate reductase [Bacteroidetes bacterium]|nr:nitrate reductase [Bacteroidota bacterium]